MIYLSRIILNSMNPKRRRTLSDCYELHRSIMSAFPDEGGGVRRKYSVLYRLKVEESRSELLVQSDMAPDWKISGFNPLCHRESFEFKEISGTIETAVANGREFTFNLTACPAKKIFAGGKNSKRILLAKEAEQIDWLVRKADQFGFAVNPSSMIVRSSGANSGRKKGIFFRSVEFSGRLLVVNRELFLEALAQGIGSEKSFGCGLLMISRDRSIL